MTRTFNASLNRGSRCMILGCFAGHGCAITKNLSPAAPADFGISIPDLVKGHRSRHAIPSLQLLIMPSQIRIGPSRRAKSAGTWRDTWKAGVGRIEGTLLSMAVLKTNSDPSTNSTVEFIIILRVLFGRIILGGSFRSEISANRER